MSWDKLTTTEKAILFLLYHAEADKKSSSSLVKVWIGGKKRKGPLTMADLIPKTSQASYKDILKFCQGLEDEDYLIAGKKKGRDEPYWPETTPLRLVAKGKKFVQDNLHKYESDAEVQKELKKLAGIEFQSK